MHYNTSYCFTPWDLFETFNIKQLKIKKTTIAKKYGCDRKQMFCSKVLMYCMGLILLDVIENNVTFMFPTEPRESCIYVKSFTGKTFQKLYSKGKFAGIDFLSSNFTGYQLYFRYKAKDTFREKPIYISHTLRDKFYENINNGKVYY